jgi:hypothetical protein
MNIQLEYTVSFKKICKKKGKKNKNLTEISIKEWAFQKSFEWNLASYLEHRTGCFKMWLLSSSDLNSLKEILSPETLQNCFPVQYTNLIWHENHCHTPLAKWSKVHPWILDFISLSSTNSRVTRDLYCH